MFHMNALENTPPIFNSSEDCVGYAKNVIDQYPHLKELIKHKNYNKWGNKLKKCEDINHYLYSKKLNLLNITATLGLYGKCTEDVIVIEQYENILKKLNCYLGCFPKLLSDKSFNGKITDIEGMIFLSTLSELTLAYHFHQKGYSIEFEKKFTPNTKENRDIDLAIMSKTGRKIYIEVYMPHEEAGDGFFSPDAANHSFSKKLSNKLFDKFREGEIPEFLNGKVLLAANITYFDELRVFMTLSSDKEPLRDKLGYIHSKAVDAILMFIDDFNKPNSLYFYDFIVL